MVPPGTPIPAEAALIVLPGSKATLADMAFLRATGWEIDILAHHRRGRAILGICGGYQMLGTQIADPLGIEGLPGEIAGLGLLAVATELSASKALREVQGQALGEGFAGYEMHIGHTDGPGAARAFARLADGSDGSRDDGAISADGMVMGTYCHGVLASTGLRRAMLARIGATSTGADYASSVDTALDELAGALEQHLDIDGLLALATAGVA
jgi:adenosylcobyric acid synthase